MANAILVKGSYSESNTKTLFFNDMSVAKSDWVEAKDKSNDYVYSADIECEGITADYMPSVVFGIVEATSGNYAPICNSGVNEKGNGIVTIYAKQIPESDISGITISAVIRTE